MDESWRGVAACAVGRCRRRKGDNRHLPARRMMRNGRTDLAVAFVDILEVKMRRADEPQTDEAEEREAQNPAAQLRTAAFDDKHRP